MNAALLRDRLERVREAGRKLRRRPAGDTLDSLCRVLDSWRDPRSQWRQELEAELPAAGGFSRETVRQGLSLALEEWSGAALRVPYPGRMVRASWKSKVIAESASTVVVEGTHYFPREAVAEGVLVESDTHTTCAWKGEASYFHVAVDGEQNPDACWTYADPKPAAEEIRGRVAFWKGVQVEE